MRRYIQLIIRSEEYNFPRFNCNFPALNLYTTESEKHGKNKAFNKKALYKLLSMVKVPK